MATPSSGTITMFDINSAFARGNNLDVYRGTVWYVPNSLTTGTFPTGQIAFSDFYNKTGTNPVTPSPVGGVSYTIPGVYQFVVPLFRTSFSVVLWGGGGGGGGGGGTVGSFTDPNDPNLHGVAGGTSSFAAAVIANGGSGGGNAGRDRNGGVSSGYGGTGGTASGGDVNTSGYDGGAGFTGYNNAHGGGSPNGGADTPNQNGAAGTNGVAGNPPGGGGQGMVGDRGSKFYAIAGGGGGGAYASKTYNPSQLVAGTTIQLIVAAGGASGPTTQGLYGGVGANGKIILNWS
jgi:hypothetical protein